VTFLLGNAPIPLTDPIARPRRRDLGRDAVDELEGRVTDPWADYFSSMAQTVGNSPTRIFTARRVGQAASIAAVDISNGALRAGLYRVSYYVQVTLPAGISSSIVVTISWTSHGAAQAETGATMTANTTDTHESRSHLINIDAGSPVRYEAIRGSAGVPGMQYRLDVVLEVIQA
jgi:hypothetical protein